MTGYSGSKTALSSRESWRTPEPIFNALNKEFKFSLDVAASDKNHLVDEYYTIENCALTQDWIAPIFSYAWCNPPYSDPLLWIEQSIRQSCRGIGTVMLVPQDQSSVWFLRSINTCDEVRIITGGRVEFIHPETGKSIEDNQSGSQFLIWHPLRERGTGVITRYINRDKLMLLGKKG